MPSADHKRLAKNTIFLYIRMFLVMGVGLFTSRVVLNALGVNDFGIYNVVGGMVALFSIVSASLSTAISRFLTFEMGKEDIERLKKIFSTSLAVQIAIVGVIIVVGVPIGFWFLNYKMNITSQRIVAANWVLCFSILTFIINLLSVPYNASLIAHEKMQAFAYVSVIEVVLKLGIAYLIYAFTKDRLIFYALLILCVSIILRLIYGVYCAKNFEECRAKIHYYKDIFKEMSSFAGWTFIGTSSFVLQNQGTNVILNLFFGTVVNAAYGIGSQVNTAVQNLGQNFMIALNPQITKSYAKGDNYHLLQLVYQGSRLSFCLMWILAIIIFLNTPYILKLWLKEVPDYTIGFVRLFLIYSLIECISQPLITAQAATGKVKIYQICVGGARFIVIPLIYLSFLLDFGPLFSLIVIIFMSVSLLFMRIFFLKKDINLSIREFITKVIGRIFIIATLSYIISFIAIFKLPEDFGFFIIRSLIIFIITVTTIFLCGCTKQEQVLIINKLQSIALKLK